MKQRKQKLEQRSSHSTPTKIDSSKKLKADYLNRLEILGLALLAICVVLIYFNSLRGPFVFDDIVNITDNPHIRLTELSLEGVARAGFSSGYSNRPLANMSFAFNYYFHRYKVEGYHLVNILIHITTAILLYLFTKTTLNVPSQRSRYGPYRWAPLLTALIWAVHPIQTQSVTYIVQRMNSMAAMFYVLSLYLYAQARLTEKKNRKWALFGGCSLAGLLALGCKEIAATLPFFIVLYEWYFFQDMRRAWLKSHLYRFGAISVVLVIAGVAFLRTNASQTILSLYDKQDFTLYERVLTEFRVVIHYISLLVFSHPSRLNLDYDFPLSHSLIDPITTLISMLAIAGFIGLAIYMARKERLLSFCILWFFGNLVIESSVIPLALIFEHRTYLPSMLVILMAVVLGYRYIKPKWLGVGLLGVAVAVFSIWTYERNGIWSDEEAFWEDCVKKSPTKARVHNNLGSALEKGGKLEEAMSRYIDALRMKPDFAEAHLNLGSALERQGRVKEAIAHYSKALRIRPNYPDAHNNLGAFLKKEGKVREAIAHYRKALRVNPDFADAHYNLGIALYEEGVLEEAVRHYHAAIRANPLHAEAHNNLGIVLDAQGKLEEAIGYYSEALRLKPDYAEAHFNQGGILLRQERLEKAIKHYSEAVLINPDYWKAHYNMGVILMRQGRDKEAAFHFSEVLRIRPEDRKARYALELLSGE